MSGVLEAISAVCLVSGAIFCAIGGYGILRLPDLYTRTHAATITDTLGAGLLLLGLMIMGGFSNVTLKLLLVLLFIYFTSPVAGHALVKAAFSSGLRAEIAPEARPRTSHPPPEPQPDPKPAGKTDSEPPAAATDGKDGGDAT